MRSIPFQVVCLVGMNDDVFPGRNALLGFDRLSDRSQRRVGDRSRRDDDRYMALEALLCARERLIITYVGRGVHDNRVIPPSVVVGELMDAVAQGFEVDDIERRLCTLHRLHAFSQRYFDRQSELFSYAKHYCDGARALGQVRGDRPLLEGPLPAAPLDELTIEELIAWVTKPIERFLQQRLGLYLGSDLAPIPEREPLALDQLERWQLGTDLLDLVERGADKDSLFAVARGKGALPLGTVGALAYEDLSAELGALGVLARERKGGERLDPLPISLEIGGVRITGTLHGLWSRAHVCTSYSRIGRRFALSHFIRHLLLNAALDSDPRDSYPRTSVVVARADTDDGDQVAAQLEFAPIDDARVVLRDLLEMVQVAHTTPLPFDYAAAYAYVKALAKALAKDNLAGAHEQALERAAASFNGDYGAGNNAYVKLIYSDFAQFTHDDGPQGFAALARRVFDPFFAATADA